jgi:hypothetical protein
VTDNHIQVTDKQWEILINEARKVTATARGIAPCKVKPVSKRAMDRLEDELEVNTKNAETTTHARAEACADVRNAVSMAAMNALMVPKSDPHIILNVDATQLTVGNAMKKQRVKYSGEQKGPLKATPVDGETGLTCLFIKFYCTINATRQAAKPIYILDSPSMPVGEIDVHEVAGLGIGAGTDNAR